MNHSLTYVIVANSVLALLGVFHRMKDAIEVLNSRLPSAAGATGDL